MISFRCPGCVYNVIPSRILFENGAVASVADEVAFLGGKRALVVSTPGRSPLAASIAEKIGDRCVGIMDEAISQVPIELARRGRRKAAELKADCLVSVGGGSSVGLAKGIAYESGLPIISVPTTYSGSEMTGFCGMTIDGVKLMHVSLKMVAHTVIYDPELTVGVPVDVSAASAMNALAHCIDAVYVPTVNPVTALAAAEGAKYIAKAAAEVVGNPEDLEARSMLLYGSFLSGVALTGGFAFQHGLAHVLGGSFGISHGLAHALVLPHVAAYNARFASDRLAPIAGALGTDPTSLGGVLFDMLAELGIPQRLSDLGLKEEDLVQAARITVETDNGANPVTVPESDVLQVLRDAWAGKRPDGRRIP